MSAARQDRLVLAVQGLACDDLAPDRTPFLSRLAAGIPRPLAVESLGLREPVDRLLDGLDVERLRRAGIDVDRRSIALRRPQQGDESVLAALPDRPRGRAQLTVLWLRDAAAAAIRYGVGSRPHHEALSQVDGLAHRAARWLGVADRPEACVVLGSPPPEPVRRRVDVAAVARRALSRRALPGRARRRLACEVHAQYALLRCRSWPDAVRVGEALRAHGLLRVLPGDPRHAELDLGTADVLLVAPRGVALGAEPLRAAPPGAPSAGSRSPLLLADPRLLPVTRAAHAYQLGSALHEALRSTEPAPGAEESGRGRHQLVEAPDLLGALRPDDAGSDPRSIEDRRRSARAR